MCIRDRPRREPGRDRRPQPPDLHEHQQRCLPNRFRFDAGGLRRGLRRTVRSTRLGRRHPREQALPDRRHDHRGRLAALRHPRPVRLGLLRPLQVQPEADRRLRQPLRLPAGPLPAAGDRRHSESGTHQAPLLPDPPADQPDEDRPDGAGARPGFTTRARTPLPLSRPTAGRPGRCRNGLIPFRAPYVE